jgi:hypothetical protein
MLTWIERSNQTVVLEIVANTGKIQSYCDIELLQQSGGSNA